jgi:predicted DNA-binding transcriptional regulator YafY
VIGDARLAAAADRALEKLMAALPVSMRARAAFIRQRLYVDPTGWYGPHEDHSFLPLVQDAVSRDRKLAMLYRGPGREQVERTVDPLGLVAKGSSWYLVAGTPAGFRTYRLSRIETATILDVPSERPTDFDLVAYWKTSTDQFRRSLPRFEVTLRLEPRAAQEVKRWRTTSPLSETPDADGWVTLQVSFDDEEHAGFIVRGFGPRVDVIEPESFRTRIAADAAVMYERLHGRRAEA